MKELYEFLKFFGNIEILKREDMVKITLEDSSVIFMDGKNTYKFKDDESFDKFIEENYCV